MVALRLSVRASLEREIMRVDRTPRLKCVLLREGAYLKCTEHTCHSALRAAGRARLLRRRWGRLYLRYPAHETNNLNRQINLASLVRGFYYKRYPKGCWWP